MDVVTVFPLVVSAPCPNAVSKLGRNAQSSKAKRWSLNFLILNWSLGLVLSLRPKNIMSMIFLYMEKCSNVLVHCMFHFHSANCQLSLVLMLDSVMCVSYVANWCTCQSSLFKGPTYLIFGSTWYNDLMVVISMPWPSCKIRSQPFSLSVIDRPW